ncbi:alpha-L-fucosidase [Undibacterium sp. Ji83W]|uniref:alpha-L-fucosidase n=1 Tax=Undibacterium sp. Ji83W TaxID=3413043 RepID=UPI003BF50DC4
MSTSRVSRHQRRLLLISSFIAATVSASIVSARAVDQYASGGNSPGYDMAPETRLEVVEAAVAALPVSNVRGPFQANWDSLKKNYQVPAWFNEAKFGIFMHWGLYSVPAHHNEWYEKHMYGADRQWHASHFGEQEKFGYKDFIPMFKQEKFDPDAWASLLKKSGARFVVPSAQHHDNFAMWDSAVTHFNARQMGPGRDLIGELAKSVRAQGLKFGVSNHGIENFQFINPPADLAARLKAKKADLYDPEWADFYHVADRSDEACKKFLVDWYLRNVELIDKYQPDMLWFDNGVDQRYLDPLKLQIAAYYYNRASQWGREVSLSTKKAAYSPSNQNTETIGSIIDFEKIGERSPSGIRPGAWQVDEPIGSTWGYTDGMKIATPASIIAKLADTVSKNGTLLLNISPKADGTIPQEQQETLLAIGQWLEVNGEAIYGTHSWSSFGIGGGRNEAGPHIRFTVKADSLYAIVIGAKPGAELLIAPLAPAKAPGKITQVNLLGAAENLTFVHDQAGLKLQLPQKLPTSSAYTLKITGLKMNPSSTTRSGNPAW